METDNTLTTAESSTLTVGGRIRLRRQEKKITMTELARQAEITKGYLSQLESGSDAGSKTSAAVLFRISQALDTTIADLLGKEVPNPKSAVPEQLKNLAEIDKLPTRDVEMLAQIRFRGRQPETLEDWRFLYDAIRRSVPEKGSKR